MKMAWIVALLAALAAMPAPAQQRGAIGAINRSLGSVDRSVKAEVGQSRPSSQGGKGPAGNTSSVTWGRATSGRSTPGQAASGQTAWGQATSGQATSSQASWGNRARANGGQDHGIWAPARTGPQSAGSRPGTGEMPGKAQPATGLAKAAPRGKGIKPAPMPAEVAVSAPAGGFHQGLENRATRFAFTGKARGSYGYRSGGEARSKAHQKWAKQLQAHRPQAMRSKHVKVKEKLRGPEPEGQKECESASKMRLCTWL